MIYTYNEDDSEVLEDGVHRYTEKLLYSQTLVFVQATDQKAHCPDQTL